MRKNIVFISVSLAFITILAFLMSGVFSYVDEILTILGIIHLLFIHKLDKWEKRIAYLLLALFIIGTAGTLICRYQIKLWPIMLDTLGCIKFFICFIYGRSIFSKVSNYKKIRIISIVNMPLKPFVIIGFFLGVANLFIDFGMSYEVRMGFRTYKYIFDDAAHLSNLQYFILFFLTANYKIKRSRNSLLLICMTLITWILTFKSRAILFALLFPLLFYIVVIKKKKISINIKSGIVLILFAVFITYDQIDNYFVSNDRMPRYLLFYGGLETMMKYWPIGAGWGTYGTDMAVKYYSPLYTELGFEQAYGLSPDYNVYAHDNYWPAIMGEFGIIGVIIELMIFFCIHKILRADYYFSRISYMYVIFVFITHLYASAVTSVFFQYQTLFLFFLLPLIKFPDKDEEYKIYHK